MFEVYRDKDSVTVGLYHQLLQQEGIDCLLRNWSSSHIVEIPIPEMYPNLCVFTSEDYQKARKIITDYQDGGYIRYPDWVCQQCGESVAGNFAECWSCQSPMSDD